VKTAATFIHTTMRLPTILLSLALLTAGCASSGAPASTSGSRTSVRRDPDVITAEELAQSSYSNLYDAIRSLRPAMLAPRGGSASSSISNQGGYTLSVYQDGVKLDGVADLRNIPVSAVHEVRYLSPTDATQRYGTGNAAGAIVISTR
jgi:outer membrane receptor for ferrienterochelin and colicin